MTDPEVARSWRQALKDLVLDDLDREGFAASGLSARLNEPIAQIAILPAVAHSDRFEVTNRLWDLLEEHHRPIVGGARVDLGQNDCPTAYAACRFNGHEGRGGPWTSYVAMHRTGAVTAGIGADHAIVRREGHGESAVIFRLVPLVARLLGVLQLHVALVEHLELAGPFQVSLGLRDAIGSHLGHFGQGWAEPFDFMSGAHDLYPCPTDRLLWNLSFDSASTNGASDLAFRMGSRIEGAWGSRREGYLDRVPPLEGQLNFRG